MEKIKANGGGGPPTSCQLPVLIEATTVSGPKVNISLASAVGSKSNGSVFYSYTGRDIRAGFLTPDVCVYPAIIRYPGVVHLMWVAPWGRCRHPNRLPLP